MKVWETAYVATLSLFDCHFLCLHISVFRVFILPLSFIAPFGAVREGFICALQGHLSREPKTRFSRSFFGTGKISQKLSLTLAMLPDAKLRAYKPGRTDSEGEKSIEIQKL